MNLFEIYEGAIENAQQNQINFDAEYIVQYVDGALDEHISMSTAQKIIDAHNEWEESEKGSNNRYYILQEPLEQIEI